MTRTELAIEHETQFVRAFLVRERRARYLQQLDSVKKRASVLDRLNHRFLGDLDKRWIRRSPPKALPKGSQSCYLMASEDQFDGRLVKVSELPGILLEARFGIVVSYSPGILAAYQDESPSELIWLQRD